MDTLPEDFTRRPFRNDLSSSAPAGERVLPPGFLDAHAPSGALPQSPRTVPAPQ